MTDRTSLTCANKPTRHIFNRTQTTVRPLLSRWLLCHRGLWNDHILDVEIDQIFKRLPLYLGALVYSASMSQPSSPTQPSFTGFVATASDAAVLLEASMQGYLLRVSCRPSLYDKVAVAQSGNVFIFEEKESKIRRWTDGIKWSPSRMLDGFMLYRELDGEQITSGHNKRLVPSHQRTSASVTQIESELYGSLIESYAFKHNGLMKKTIGVKFAGSEWRLVSYYNADDVRSGILQCPSRDPGLQSIAPNEDIRRQLQCWHITDQNGTILYGCYGHFDWMHVHTPSPIDCHYRRSMDGYVAEYEQRFHTQSQWYSV